MPSSAYTGDLVATPALRYWRLQASYGRAELSRATGVGHDTIARLERGARTQAATATRLADFLEQELEHTVDLYTPFTPERQAWLDRQLRDYRW
jgi:transcriptional regulator with XRE-family HTH domain